MKLNFKKKTQNWAHINSQSNEDKLKYRDVYETQQLERSKIEDMANMTGRRIALTVALFVVWLIVYFVMSVSSYFIDGNNYSKNPYLLDSEGYYVHTEEFDLQYYLDEMEKAVALDEKNNLETEKPAFPWLEESESDSPSEVSKVEEYEESNRLLRDQMTFSRSLLPTWSKFYALIFVMLIGFGIGEPFLRRNLAAQNALRTTSDINQYANDQHIALPDETIRNYNIFPNVGAHSSVEVSGLISHAMVSNKGIKKIWVAERANKDIYDEDGNIEYFKGEELLDKDGNIKMKQVPMFDKDFGEALFDASDLPKDKAMRKYFDATTIEYNPGGANRDKGPYEKMSDLINEDWDVPYYEPQRPSGVYIVDTDPVNTMVLAITRAGKGQTVIEPTLDMWTREKTPHNMVINDPKGELLVNYYERGTVRGFQIVQFNLINSMKTDIYNPLGMAAEAAREGDSTKCAQYVENIAEVFFPVDGGDDPVWPNAANNAFKRTAYGMIDYYLEEEAELRQHADRVGMDAVTLESTLDTMWGKVTLYNCYQFFTQLSSKEMKNPAIDFLKRYSDEEKIYNTELISIMKNAGCSDDDISDPSVRARYEHEVTFSGEFFGELGNEQEESEREMKMYDGNERAAIWEEKPKMDMLSLFFAASDKLPKNSMRTLVGNANNALKSMAGAEKMMSSVYGIAITAMSFFTDPTISTLTSGKPSQNVDLAGMSFPRRFGVRLHPDYLEKANLAGKQAKWTAYHDKEFKNKIDGEFEHYDLVTREGWAKCFFKGIFETDVAYMKLEILNPDTTMLIKTFYFKFEKLYQMSLDSRYYVTDPVLGTKLIKNGVLTELARVETKSGNVRYKKGKSTFKQRKIVNVRSANAVEDVDTPIITRTMARYSEKPKAVFLVTPPHLMKYAKLILILLKQLVNLNFDQSYMTKSNQKPLYKTRFMLDELGNLQSEGQGISGFETMLSIGLGQEQQFTIILQTLQQLRDVYGDSVDKIVQGNTSNIVFLKSTDDSMIDTLQKMSGTTHTTYTDSKTVTMDNEQLLFRSDGRVSYTMTTKEEPVLKYNDFAFISPRNSIVLRAGDIPIWNRNETILPMSWRLFMNRIKTPGKTYSLQTIPTLSTALNFDVRKNQPNFMKMLEKRLDQAVMTNKSVETYTNAYGYDDYGVEALDPDVYSSDIMLVVSEYIREFHGDYSHEESAWADEADIDEYAFISMPDVDITENVELADIVRERMSQKAANDAKIFAGGTLSKGDFIDGNRLIGHTFDNDICVIYQKLKNHMAKDSDNFSMFNGELRSKDGSLVYISPNNNENLAHMNELAKDESSRVFAENDINQEDLKAVGQYIVSDDFIRFLGERDTWSDIVNGKWEREFAKQMNK